MSELPRLIEEDDDLERELIRSAHHDRPGERALERTLLRLGVGLALPSAVASAAPATAAATQLGVTGLVKSLVTGVALGVVTAGGAHVAGRVLAQRAPGSPHALGSSASPSAPVPTGTHRSTLREAERPAPPTTEAVPAPAAATAPVEAAETAPLARPPSTSLEPRFPAPNSSSSTQRPGSSLGSFALDTHAISASALAAETQRVEAARRALADGRAALALTTLASYERDFPRGVLRPEALVLKVRALVAAGDRPAAEALGRRLIAQAPTSGHADAVRAALGHGTNP
jgi:hypothetical protein